MKIILISASPRREKSQTLLLANEVLKGCNDLVNHDVIHLCDFKIEFCRHLEECHKRIMDCPIKDDVRMILERILDAEGIILASPNYINQVTASMKALFDRSSHFIHCQRMLGKYVASVVSSGSGQDKDVLDYIKYYAFTCGAQYSGGVSSRAPVGKDKMAEAHKLGKRLVSDIESKRTYDEQMRIIDEGREHFKQIILARKEEWPAEYKYWQDKDWL